MLKKGEVFDVASKTIYWMIASVMIAVILLAFSLILVKYKNNLTYVSPKLEASLIAMRFTNIPECFAYEDPETDRVYPGIIDLSKFNPEQMEKCYKTSSAKEINFKLRLENKGIEVITDKYYNNPAQNNIGAAQGPFLLPLKVMVKDYNTVSEDTLHFEVQLKI